MAGLDGFGVLLERSDMAPTTPVFTAIAGITNLGGPELERETYDVTAHDSPDAWREFVGGLKDGGEVSLDINYNPAVHDVLVADFGDDTPRDYRITWPQVLAEWDIKAVMTGFNPEAPHDDKMSAEITLKVTGKPTITAGP